VPPFDELPNLPDSGLYSSYLKFLNECSARMQIARSFCGALPLPFVQLGEDRFFPLCEEPASRIYAARFCLCVLRWYAPAFPKPFWKPIWCFRAEAREDWQQRVLPNSPAIYAWIFYESCSCHVSEA